jgi:hypothetical protein
MISNSVLIKFHYFMHALKEGLVGERRLKHTMNLQISLLTEDLSLEFEPAELIPPSCLLDLPPGRKDCGTKPVLGDYQK